MIRWLTIPLRAWIATLQEILWLLEQLERAPDSFPPDEESDPWDDIEPGANEVRLPAFDPVREEFERGWS